MYEIIIKLNDTKSTINVAINEQFLLNPEYTIYYTKENYKIIKCSLIH